ncbi:aminopeptidase Q [Hyperolius riggenbachi]|uniref:aminopeptidase Q n=1 Tax=Hyperolius riggenbachi TaxID=752182 RepID=UPI0035A2AC7C
MVPPPLSPCDTPSPEKGAQHSSASTLQAGGHCKLGDSGTAGWGTLWHSEMGPKNSSGFYLSRTSAALLALLLAALLLALIVLGALYARTVRTEPALGQPDANISAVNATSAPFFFTFPTEATGPPGIWDNPRLPHHLLPSHYDLELWPRMQSDDEGHYHLSGQVNITMTCVEGTDVVLLHSYQLNITRAVLSPLGNGQSNYKSGHLHSKFSLAGPKWDSGGGLDSGDKSSPHLQETDAGLLEDGQNIGISNLWNSERQQYLVLELERPLVAGHLYLLQLDYVGHLSYDYSGLFISHYEDQGEVKALVGSELEPASARTVYPCFDEPALKATFKISIVHNSSYVALSNMPAIAVSERKDANGTEWKVTTFNTTLKMSTYITAFVVCDFDYVSTTVRGNEIRVWARKEVIQNGSADYALSIVGPILSFMEDLLNVSYPLQKTDFVAFPDFGVGAMENWGLITFQEHSLAYNPNQKFSNAKALTCLIVAHEIGHQWFGNLVTMKWWNDIWLNEGFASYMEYIGANFAEPKFKLNEFFMLHNLVNIFEKDARTSARSVSVKEEDINNVYNILLLFDDFTYNKAAALLRMASRFLTEKLFLKGISSYLKKFSFSNAGQDDLWNHLQMLIDDQDEVRLPASLKEIMDSWTWQKGIPLVTVNTSTGMLAQNQFKTATSDNITSDNDTWIIPIFWMKNGVEQPTVWLDAKTKFFPEMMAASENDWIVLNINVTGYYRVNYDEKNVNNIAKQLGEAAEVLPVVNRIQLIDDAFILANAGHLEYETALNLTRYLEQEMEIIVWYIFLKHLHHYRTSLVTYNSFPLIKKYILKRINPIFQHYASIVRRNVDETADDFFVHTGIDVIFKTACFLGLQDCLSLAKEIYTKWMTNASSNEIPQSIKGTIYCYGIAEGGEKEWEFAWNVYNKSASENEDGWEQSYLKHGMSCTKEPWLLYRYVENLIAKKNIHAIMGAFLDMFKNDIGRHIAWEFLKENWHRLNELYSTSSGPFYESLLPDLGWKATSELQFQEMQLFITTTIEESEREGELLKLESRKKARLEWLTVVNTRITDWLQKNTLDSDF